jgi:CelD/BcsL family acetyltransferase involved in cellulose biosynthesis
VSGAASVPGAGVTVREVTFDTPGLEAIWERLLEASDTRLLPQSFVWQRLWWDTLGRGRLVLLLAERAGEPVAIAPLCALEGMLFFLGAGETDQGDFIGAGHDPAVLTALLAAARERTADFAGAKFYFLPERSRTTAVLPTAAAALGLELFEMGDLDCVEVDIARDPEAVRRAVSRSMRKAENFFHSGGVLTVQRLTTAAEVLPLLPEFFAMHVARWRLKEIDSPYLVPAARTFLTRWIEVSAARGWLRVVRLDWNGRTLGMDLNWHHGTRQHSGQWVFDIEHFRRSPGQILLRHSVLMALDAGMHTYDLGLGDQTYKFRLPADRVRTVTWGLYPPE